MLDKHRSRSAVKYTNNMLKAFGSVPNTKHTRVHAQGDIHRHTYTHWDIHTKGHIHRIHIHTDTWINTHRDTHTWTWTHTHTYLSSQDNDKDREVNCVTQGV